MNTIKNTVLASITTLIAGLVITAQAAMISEVSRDAGIEEILGSPVDGDEIDLEVTKSFSSSGPLSFTLGLEFLEGDSGVTINFEEDIENSSGDDWSGYQITAALSAETMGTLSGTFFGAEWISDDGFTTTNGVIGGGGTSISWIVDVTNGDEDMANFSLSISNLNFGAGTTAQLPLANVGSVTITQTPIRPTTPPTDMPEPGTLALFGLGLASLGLRRKLKAHS